MVKKNSGVLAMDMPQMPSLSLDGEHAKKFIKHKIGKKVKFVVHGTKTRHSMYNDKHSVGIDIHKVALMNDVDDKDGNESE